MENSVKKSILLQSIKAGLLSLVFSCIGTLLLALIAKLCNLGDGILPIINQILKVIAVALGTLIAVKEEKFLVKAVVGAVLYWLLSFALFAILGGQIHFGQIALDLGISLIVAAVIALIKNKRSA